MLKLAQKYEKSDEDNTEDDVNSKLRPKEKKLFKKIKSLKNSFNETIETFIKDYGKNAKGHDYVKFFSEKITDYMDTLLAVFDTGSFFSEINPHGIIQDIANLESKLAAPSKTNDFMNMATLIFKSYLSVLSETVGMAGWGEVVRGPVRKKTIQEEGDVNDAKCSGTKKSPVGSPRQKAFCARHCGLKKKLTSKEVADDPDSCINQGLRRWKCRCK